MILCMFIHYVDGDYLVLCDSLFLMLQDLGKQDFAPETVLGERRWTDF